MSSLLLIDYLQRCHAHFHLLRVAPAETANGIVRQLPRPLARNFAKVVMLRLDGELAMTVLPAQYRVSLEALRVHLGASRIELASERQFRNHFPRCEAGAIPPIAHIFGLRGFLAPVFDESSDIAFKAGSHAELLRMSFGEFRRLAHLDPLAEGVVPQLRSAASVRRRLLPALEAAGAQEGAPRRERWRRAPMPL
jgi:Ala-tRNA(Pro) deacylase